jgi:hypothetical protein
MADDGEYETGEVAGEEGGVEEVGYVEGEEVAAEEGADGSAEGGEYEVRGWDDVVCDVWCIAFD